MKKHIQTIITPLLAVLLLNGCYKLELNPYDEVSEAIFWKNEEQVKQAMMGVYNQMKPEQSFGLKFNNDCLADLQVGNSNGTGYKPMITGTATDQTAQISQKWQNLFDGVQRANLVIRKVTEMQTLDQTKKALYIAEARFMRALYYFELYAFFGQLPLYDETVDLNKDYMNLMSARSSVDDVLKFIVDDLTAAAENLPVHWDASDYGRATKGAAYAFRGKVQLFQNNYPEAKHDFEEIILDPDGLGYNYALHSSYAELFTPEGDQSSEMIFSIQNKGGVGMNYGMPMTFYLGNRSSFGSCWNDIAPSVTLVDMYECKDGKPFVWNDFIPGYDESDDVKAKTFHSTLTNGVVSAYPEYKEALLAMYTERDPRMGETILLPYTFYNGNVSNSNDTYEYVIGANAAPHEKDGYVRVQGSYKIYLYRKFVAEGDMGGTITDRAHTPINFPLFRLADVYLMYAECMNELNDQATAVEYINKVRQRPSTNMPALNSGPSWLKASTREAVFERIMQERAVELAAEGHRYNDLRRWGLAIEMLNGKPEKEITGKTLYTHEFTEKQLLWPIPGVETDMNPALKPNNPGW